MSSDTKPEQENQENPFLALAETHDNLMEKVTVLEDMSKNIDELKTAREYKLMESQMDLFDKYYSKLRSAFNNYDRISLKFSAALNDNLLVRIESLEATLKKYKTGRTTQEANATNFWEPYRKIFDADMKSGKSESWALNKIGNLIEGSGKWDKQSNKDSVKRIKRPDRGTLRRQLITNRR